MALVSAAYCRGLGAGYADAIRQRFQSEYRDVFRFDRDFAAYRAKGEKGCTPGRANYDRIALAPGVPGLPVPGEEVADDGGESAVFRYLFPRSDLGANNEELTVTQRGYADDRRLLFLRCSGDGRGRVGGGRRDRRGRHG